MNNQKNIIILIRKTGLLMFYIIFIVCSRYPDDIQNISFFDDFEKGLNKWTVTNPAKIKIIDSGNLSHNNVMALFPGGSNIFALIRNSDNWTNYKIEGDLLFPENSHNYLGFMYNYNISGTRDDYGCIYIKGNSSYIRVNPHRDAQVSRTIYEEYRTQLSGRSAIIIGEWKHFKAEIIEQVCHFYVEDMETPKITFNYFEYSSGAVGFEPRVYGSECWIDNISVESIGAFAYKGGILPSNINYNPEQFLTEWDVIGPFRQSVKNIENDWSLSEEVFESGNTQYRWKSFKADGRGCVVTGKTLEFGSRKKLAYYHTKINSDTDKRVRLIFSTTDALTIWMNGKFNGELQPTYFAWYDFLDNPDHKGGEIYVELKKGINHLMILVEGVGQKYTGDGFFAHVDSLN